MSFIRNVFDIAWSNDVKSVRSVARDTVVATRMNAENDPESC